jgi:hypothetical protein
LFQCLGRFLGISDEDPSVSKSKQLHVDCFQFIVVKIGVYSIDFSKAIRTFLEVLNFNWLFLNLNRFSPFIGLFSLFDTAISFKSPNQFLGVDL